MKVKKLLFLILIVGAFFIFYEPKSYADWNSWTPTGDPAEDIVRCAEAQQGKGRYELGYNDDWCAYFVTSCATKAGVGNLVGNCGVVGDMYYDIINNRGGKVVTNPQRGDLVFYYCTYCQRRASYAHWNYAR